MALAMQRVETKSRSLLMLARAVLTDPEPMLARLVRGCIAMAFTREALGATRTRRMDILRTTLS